MPSAVYEQNIRQGKTPEQAAQAELEAVYGAGFKRDRNGKPVEKGIGSAGNPSEQHFTAIERWEGKDAADAARAKARTAR
jgi:hypothetical protein